MPSEGEPARRGRSRNTAVDQRVLDVAWDLLLTGGYAGLNMDEVAERAAVAKTTLYRRWPTKDHRSKGPSALPWKRRLRHHGETGAHRLCGPVLTVSVGPGAHWSP